MVEFRVRKDDTGKNSLRSKRLSNKYRAHGVGERGRREEYHARGEGESACPETPPNSIFFSPLRGRKISH